MVARDENGKFLKGNEGGPGRPKKQREQVYYDILVTSVTQDDWKAIVTRAVADAKRGDATARKWLADYLIGAPVQRTELTGAEGGGLNITITRRGDG